MHKTEENLFFVRWTRQIFLLQLNGVLENVLVCVHISSKLANAIQCLWFIIQLFRFLGLLSFF